MPSTSPLRRGLATLVVTLIAFTLAACGNDKPEPIPTPTTEAWRAQYSKAQLDEYDKALDRWNEYLEKVEPINAAGKVTPEAKALFAEYWGSTGGMGLTGLQTYEKYGLTTVGKTKVLWSKATTIVASDVGARVTFQRCIDPDGVKVMKDGKEQPHTAEGPRLATTTMTRGAHSDFIILESFSADPAGKVTPCVP